MSQTRNVVSDPLAMAGICIRLGDSCFERLDDQRYIPLPCKPLALGIRGQDVNCGEGSLYREEILLLNSVFIMHLRGQQSPISHTARS